MSDKRVAIVGSGAMGSLLGAKLVSEGISVTMVDAVPAVVDAINEKGLTVCGTTELSVPARAYLPEEMEDTFDLVILLTKQTQNAVCFPQIAAHLADDGIVVTLQNGVPERSLADYFGVDRVMGCAVTWAATLLEPGITLSTAQEVNWHNSLGRLDGKITEPLIKIQDLLSHMCHTQVVTNLMGLRWSKLLINSSFTGMSAALGYTFGEILDDPDALRCACHIARECILTAKAAGIEMVPLREGEDLTRLMYFESEEERQRVCAVFRQLFTPTAAGKGSILVDLQLGRKSEIDYINGVVSRTAAQYDIRVPYCDAAVRTVKACEAGEIVPSRENLSFFPH